MKKWIWLIIGLMVIAIVIWWRKRGATITGRVETQAIINKIKAESEKIGRQLTVDEANEIVYTEPELRTGITTKGGFVERVLIPAIDSGLISMTREDIDFWLNDTRVDGFAIPKDWEVLEEKAKEISEIMGTDISASEMRDAARQVERELDKQEAIEQGLYEEETIENYPWRTGYKVAQQAEELGIDVEGKSIGEVQDELYDLPEVKEATQKYFEQGIDPSIAKKMAAADAVG